MPSRMLAGTRSTVHGESSVKVKSDVEPRKMYVKHVAVTLDTRMGSSEATPHPRSTKAPKGSNRVTRAGITSPGASRARYSSRQRSCAARRESTGRAIPLPSSSKPVTVKHTGLPTRVRTAISRVEPSARPAAASSWGITP